MSFDADCLDFVHIRTMTPQSTRSAATGDVISLRASPVAKSAGGAEGAKGKSEMTTGPEEPEVGRDALPLVTIVVTPVGFEATEAEAGAEGPEASEGMLEEVLVDSTAVAFEDSHRSSRAPV